MSESLKIIRSDFIFSDSHRKRTVMSKVTAVSFVSLLLASLGGESSNDHIVSRPPRLNSRRLRVGGSMLIWPRSASVCNDNAAAESHLAAAVS